MVTKQMSKYVWVMLLALLLAACSKPAPVATPTARPAQLPAEPTSPQPPEAPAPTIAAEGANLPGRLLFSAGGDLWLWQGESGHQITKQGDAFQPAWSPSGDRLAYVRRAQSASDIVLLQLADDNQLALTSFVPDQPMSSIERVYESMWAFYPSFSPDGSQLAFVSQAAPPYGSPATDYRLTIYQMAAQAGAERIQLFADDGANVGRLAFSPDGATILFSYQPDGPAVARIYRYDTVSSAAEPLPGVPEQSYDPAPSPDGQWLAFAARGQGGTDIYLLPASGAGQPVRVTSSGTARAPAFSPDGSRLAFLAVAPGERGFDLWVLELAEGGVKPGAEPQRLTTDMGIDADSGISWGI
jgi:TolB protein